MIDPGSRQKPYKPPHTRLFPDVGPQPPVIAFCRQDFDFRKLLQCLPGKHLKKMKPVAEVKKNPNDGTFLLANNGDCIPDAVTTDMLRAFLSDFPPWLL